MTVSNENKRNGYDGTGSEDTFAFSFKIQDETHIQVILIENDDTEVVQTLTTHYTVSGVDDQSGGNIVMVTPPAADERIVILYNVPFTQAADYIAGGAFPAESHEDVLDKIIMILKQQQEQIDRCLKLSPGSEMTLGYLPDPVDNKGLKGDTDEESYILTTDDLT